MINKIQTISEFRRALGNQTMEYVPWKGYRINQNLTRNEVVFWFKKNIPRYPTAAEKVVIRDTLKAIKRLNFQKIKPITTLFEKSIVKVIKAFDNLWFNLLMGYDRKECLERIESRLRIKNPPLQSKWDLSKFFEMERGRRKRRRLFLCH